MGKQMKISEFEQLNSEQMNSSEVIEISQEEDGILKSKRNPLSRLGNWINNTFNFNTLQTYNKNLVDGINEKREIRVGYYGGPAHNSVYRGKWLGTAPTEAQLDAIENGSFDDLYIGDFWSNSSDPTSDEIRWRIAGFNYFQNVGLDNEVLRNHAVIIPDTPIAGGNSLRFGGLGLDSGSAGYKYQTIRGYEHDSVSINSQDNPDVDLTNKIIHNLPHIPIHVANIYDNTGAIYDYSGNAHGAAFFSYPILDYGEDPQNPGKGYVHFSTSHLQVICGGDGEYEVDIPPEQWDIFRYSRHFQIWYTYYTGTGSLIDAKQIIFNKFGEEHVMQHQTLLEVSELKHELSPGIYNMPYKKEWTDVTVEIPTSAMIFGNSSFSCCGEHMIDEYSYQLSFPNKPSYLSEAQHAPDQVRLPVNIGIKGGEPYKESGHIESYQLPLFLYDPALIHPGYYYWLRNSSTREECYEADSGTLYYNRHQRFNLVDYNGRILPDWSIGNEEADLRPYFCLAKYNTPK